jgi:hypothetical protein
MNIYSYSFKVFFKIGLVALLALSSACKATTYEECRENAFLMGNIAGLADKQNSLTTNLNTTAARLKECNKRWAH